MKPEQHDELPKRAKNDTGNDGAGAKEEGCGAREGARNDVHHGADDQPGARHGDGQGDHGHKHELQHLGDDLLGALLDVAGKKRGQKDGEEGARVAGRCDRQAKEREAAFCRDGRDKVGVEERGADRGGHVLVAPKDLTGREANDDGHEVKHGICSGVPKLVGAVGLGHKPKGDEQGKHALDDAAANHGPKNRHDAARDGLEEAVPKGVLTDLFYGGLGVLGKTQIGADERGHVRDVRADDDLVLAALVHDALDAVDRANRGLVGHGVVFEDKAQPSHAVGDADHVLFAANGVCHGVSEVCVILSHFLLPCMGRVLRSCCMVLD